LKGNASKPWGAVLVRCQAVSENDSAAAAVVFRSDGATFAGKQPEALLRLGMRQESKSCR